MIADKIAVNPVRVKSLTFKPDIAI